MHVHADPRRHDNSYHEVREGRGVAGLLEGEIVAQAHGVHQMVHCRRMHAQQVCVRRRQGLLQLQTKRIRRLTLSEVADGVGDEPPAVVLLDDVGGDDEDLAGAQLARVVADPEQPPLPPRHQHQVRVPPRVLVRDLLRRMRWPSSSCVMLLTN